MEAPSDGLMKLFIISLGGGSVGVGTREGRRSDGRWDGRS